MSVVDVESFFNINKENRICAMTRYHVRPNTNILLTRNLSFDSGGKQSSHPLMTLLHCFI